MTDACADVRTALGAYVLGALDVESRAEVERHVQTCAACRDELAALAGMPAVLARMTESDLLDSATDEPPADLLDRTLHELRAHRSRSRRRGTLLAAAASVAILALGGVAVGVGTSGPHATKLTSVSASGAITVDYTLRQKATGTAITVWMRGVPRGENCRLVAVSRSGRSETAATWVADYAGHVDVDATTSFARKDIAELQIVDHSGALLVSTTL